MSQDDCQCPAVFHPMSSVPVPNKMSESQQQDETDHIHVNIVNELVQTDSSVSGDHQHGVVAQLVDDSNVVSTVTDKEITKSSRY